MATPPRKSGPDLGPLGESAKAHDALLRELYKSVLPLLAKSDVPLFIKVFVAGFIFMGIYASGSVLILLADVATSFSDRRIDVRTYLISFAATLGVLLLAISVVARAALRYESERALEANMVAVTRARRQRMPDHAVAVRR
jgi:hypothetical protein